MGILSENYKKHYLATHQVYPSVFALKFFLGRNPNHDSRELGNLSGLSVLDIGFGDGRDLALYQNLGMDVYGIEVEEAVVRHTRAKFKNLIPSTNLILGSNIRTGFTQQFDFVTAFSSLFYLENETVTFHQVLQNVVSLLKKPNRSSPGGKLFCTLARNGTHVLSGAKREDKNTFVLDDPHYKFRRGQRYFVFNDREEVVSIFRANGLDIDGIYEYEANWFGSLERLFIVKARLSFDNNA